MRWIAIPFELNEGWLGGSYYIRNLISAMALLPAERQPFILMISDEEESFRFIAESGYPHLGRVTNDQFRDLAAAGAVDVVFPHPVCNQEARTISWIPDFQELHLGYFFSDDEIVRRRGHHRRRFATAGLIVSSEDVRADVDRFYPGECSRIAVVRFASFDGFDPSKVAATRQKYGLPERYLFCANQVWLHKNHILVLRAMSHLREMGVDAHMVFTGNEADYRVAGYAAFLKRQAAEWGIADRMHFLGFIPRDDQLCLMKGARYIVQPSLFEGWSTVIEDAKSMGKFIVASDLAVHKEQLTEACRFFFRHDPLALAEVIRELEAHEELTPRRADYALARQRFADDFMAAVAAFLPEADASASPAGESRGLALALAAAARNAGDAAPVAEPVSQPAAAPPPAPSAMPSATAFRTALDFQGDSYRALMIFADKPLVLGSRYEKFLLKVVRLGGDMFVELRSGSIAPAIVGAENADGQDRHGHFMRIRLEPEPGGHRLKGEDGRLSGAVQADINAALAAGLDRVRAQADGNMAAVPDFLMPALDGIRIGAMV